LALVCQAIVDAAADVDAADAMFDPRRTLMCWMMVCMIIREEKDITTQGIAQLHRLFTDLVILDDRCVSLQADLQCVIDKAVSITGSIKQIVRKSRRFYWFEDVRVSLQWSGVLFAVLRATSTCCVYDDGDGDATAATACIVDLDAACCSVGWFSASWASVVCWFIRDSETANRTAFREDCQACM
jgi:hypothetical protein